MPKHRLRSLPQEATAKIRVSERRKIGLVQHRHLSQGSASEIPEKCSELTSA